MASFENHGEHVRQCRAEVQISPCSHIIPIFGERYWMSACFQKCGFWVLPDSRGSPRSEPSHRAISFTPWRFSRQLARPGPKSPECSARPAGVLGMSKNLTPTSIDLSWQGSDASQQCSDCVGIFSELFWELFWNFFGTFFGTILGPCWSSGDRKSPKIVPKKFPNSSKQVPTQIHDSSKKSSTREMKPILTEKFPKSSKIVPKQFQNSSKIVPKTVLTFLIVPKIVPKIVPTYLIVPKIVPKKFTK